MEFISHPPAHVTLAPFRSLGFDVNVFVGNVSFPLCIGGILEFLKRTETLFFFVFVVTVTVTHPVLYEMRLLFLFTLDQAMLPQLASSESFSIALFAFKKDLLDFCHIHVQRLI